MKDLKIDLCNTKLDEEELLKYSKKVADIHKELYKKADDEKEFLGWLKLPTDYDKKEFKRIEKAAKKVQRDFRCIPCNRNWRIIFRCKSSNRSYE